LFFLNIGLVLMAFINWLLNSKGHANTYFFQFSYGNMIWFFILLRDLAACTPIKHIFVFFLSEKISRQFFGISWNFSEKQELWYQVSILQYKFTTPIWSIKLRKTCEGPTNKLKMLHEFFWNFLRFFKGLFVRVLR